MKTRNRRYSRSSGMIGDKSGKLGAFLSGRIKVDFYFSDAVQIFWTNCINERLKESMGYRSFPGCYHAQAIPPPSGPYIAVFSFCSCHICRTTVCLVSFAAVFRLGTQCSRFEIQKFCYHSNVILLP